MIFLMILVDVLLFKDPDPYFFRLRIIWIRNTACNYLRIIKNSRRYASSCSLESPAGIMVGRPGIQVFAVSFSQRDLRFLRLINNHTILVCDITYNFKKLLSKGKILIFSEKKKCLYKISWSERFIRVIGPLFSKPAI